MAVWTARQGVAGEPLERGNGPDRMPAPQRAPGGPAGRSDRRSRVVQAIARWLGVEVRVYDPATDEVAQAMIAATRDIHELIETQVYPPRGKEIGR
jgi:hypothetical protein